jgi:hypothetical protein
MSLARTPGRVNSGAAMPSSTAVAGIEIRLKLNTEMMSNDLTSLFMAQEIL